ncbi:MAG: WYL domain-containing protein [Chthoniobacteraceae bacterium]|jgi:proteasome accessory factor B
MVQNTQKWPGEQLPGRYSRPPLERMMRLHERLKAREFPNCRKLASEMEVSAKTIQRDIDFMRDRLGLPIEYDALQFGFYYTEPVTNFPSIEVSQGEIIALFVARKALEQYRGTSFERSLRTAFQKISDGLREKVDFQWSDLESAVSFRGLGTSAADIDLFECVSKAVIESREIEFEYKKAKSAAYEARRVRPYHLGCVSDQWYLFGFDLARGQIRTFVLQRMRGARRTAARFRKPADFSINKHLSGSFGVFSGHGHYAVRIRFDALAGQLVSERRWHGSQKIKQLPGGGVEMRMELGSLEEVERWILSWGKRALVLGPRELVERIRGTVRLLDGAYAKE